MRFTLTGAAWKDQSDNQAPQFVYFAPSRTGAAANQSAIAALSAKTPAPDDARVADWDAGSRTAKNDRYYQGTLRGEYDLGGATLVSLTNYADTKINSPNEVDGTDYQNAFFTQVARLKTFSQEVRVNGTVGNATLRWLLGGNYQHASTDKTLLEAINITNNSVGPFVYNNVNLLNNQRFNT